MAAHLKTGIEQILEEIEREERGGKPVDKASIFAATQIATFTEDDWDTWSHLHEFAKEGSTVSLAELKEKLEADLYRANILWVKYGLPKSREAWRQAWLFDKVDVLKDVVEGRVIA